MVEKIPRIGVAVIIIKDGKVLLGKRKNSHGSGTWCFPGGHLEFNEELENCVRRENLEETGINIKNIRFGSLTNDLFKEEGRHYVTLFFVADYDSGDVRVMEPEKCDEWKWFDVDKLPNNLFLPIQNLLKTGFNLLNEPTSTPNTYSRRTK